jgi:hypothetical protein
VQFLVGGSTYLPAEPAGSTDSVDVELTVVGQVVVDDQRDLLHVNAARPHVSGDQDTALTRPLMQQKHLQTVYYSFYSYSFLKYIYIILER